MIITSGLDFGTSNSNSDLLVILTGKSGSGKTTLRKELEKHGFSPVITKTTRLPRKGEVEGIDYNFIQESEFVEKDFCLVGTNEKGEKYGVDKKDLFKKGFNVLVTGRGGVEEISGMVEDQILKYKSLLLINLDFSNFTLIKRLLKRGDDKNQIRNRLLSDSHKYKGFSPILNNIKISGGSINEIVELILTNLKSN